VAANLFYPHDDAAAATAAAVATIACKRQFIISTSKNDAHTDNAE